jgi:hypothetical protein
MAYRRHLSPEKNPLDLALEAVMNEPTQLLLARELLSGSTRPYRPYRP